MSLKDLIIGFVAVLALAVGVVSLMKDADAPLGAQPGLDHLSHEFFMSAITTGGVVATSTDDTTATLVAANLKDVTRIDFSPSVSGITATLPATSTLSSFIPKRGDTRRILLCNATTTAAMPFTLAFGTGMNDVLATSTLAIGTNYCASLIFSRQADSDIDVFYDLGY